MELRAHKRGTVELRADRQFVLICGRHGVLLCDTAEHQLELRVRHPSATAVAVWELDLSDMECARGGETCSNDWYLGFQEED